VPWLVLVWREFVEALRPLSACRLARRPRHYRYAGVDALRDSRDPRHRD